MKKPTDTQSANGPTKDENQANKSAGTRTRQPLAELNSPQQKPSEQAAGETEQAQSQSAQKDASTDFCGPLER